MVDDDYEIISHKEVEKLKSEIQALKEGEFSEAREDLIRKINKFFTKKFFLLQ